MPPPTLNSEEPVISVSRSPTTGYLISSTKSVDIEGNGILTAWHIRVSCQPIRRCAPRSQ